MCKMTWVYTRIHLRVHTHVYKHMCISQLQTYILNCKGSIIVNKYCNSAINHCPLQLKKRHTCYDTLQYKRKKTKKKNNTSAMYPVSFIEQLEQNLGDSPKHINNENNMETCQASSFVRNVDKYISIVTTHWNIQYEGYYIFKMNLTVIFIINDDHYCISRGKKELVALSKKCQNLFQKLN